MTRLPIIVGMFMILVMASVGASQDLTQSGRDVGLYEADNIRNFACHLRDEGDFLRAAAEFDRLRFILGSTPGADSALYQAGACYLDGGDVGLAIERFRQIGSEHSRSGLALAATFQQAKATYFQNGFKEVTALLDRNSDGEIDSDLVSTRSRDLFCLSLARLERWSDAKTVACGTHQSEVNSDRNSDLCLMIHRGSDLPNKSKLKAAVMSTIVPGLGKVYAGRKVDALVALSIVGSFAWQSVRGFQQNGSGSTQGWIFGILATGFHLGNIYGATVSVGIYNDRLRHDYFHEMETKLITNGP